jgi:hypothetical protein
MQEGKLRSHHLPWPGAVQGDLYVKEERAHRSDEVIYTQAPPREQATTQLMSQEVV